jgi:hypothetical protein
MSTKEKDMKKTKEQTKEQKIESLIDLRDYRDSISRQIIKIQHRGIHLYTTTPAYLGEKRVWVDNEDLVKEMEDASVGVIIGILKKELRSVRAKIGKIKIN